MTAALRPANESQRLLALAEYQILDTAPEPSFDELTSLAANICDAPMALISLIDAERQWFKSSIGVPFRETSRDIAFCAHAMLEPDVFVVENMADDPRFADNPLVTGELQVRFYASVPLATPAGDAIGTLCVMDRRRRQLKPSQVEALRVLGLQVIAQLELRRLTSFRARQYADNMATLLAAIVESSDDAIVGKDLDSIVTSWNSGAERIFGYTAAEMLGTPITRIIPEDRRAEEATIIERIRNGDAISQMHTERITRDGRRIDVSVSASPIRNQQGRVIGVSKIARDVTEQNRAAAAKRVSDERYRTLFEHAPDGILIVDADNRCVDANDRICRMLGYSREELTRLQLQDIIGGARVEQVTAALNETLASAAEYRREWNLVRSDHTMFPAEVLATRMPDGNSMQMIRDLTERKRLERQFLRAQRMEGIGTLAGGIAHDLNNVLAPILMSIESLRDSVTSSHDLDLLMTLQRSAQRGAELVKQVLSFARGVEGERMIVNPIPLARDLVRVIGDTFPKSVLVQIRHDRDLWKVMGDATQINQVLLNLCVNARDAMPAGGTLTIRMTNAVLDDTYAGMNPESVPGAYVVIEVEDTGTGIAPEARDRIFEPFFTTKEIGKGTGLGLSTTLAIVKSHHGFINVYSELGSGTRFKVYLPALTSEAATEEPAAARTGLPCGNGELILIVDDDAAVRFVAQRTLERFGYRVLVAAHGAEAVALYAQFRSDIKVVLTDMAMPIMDGPALIVALKAMNPNVLIIGSSGLGANGGVARAIGAGVHHFAPKPYTADVLLQMIHTVLGEAR